MNFKPLNDNCLIKRFESAVETKGGIIIPDRSQEKPLEGLVVAVGDGKRDKDGILVPMIVKEGDKVMVSKFAGTEIKLGEEDFLLVREEEVLGILRDA
jgi:chaperonin GroES